jgi:hypothetical protein
MAFYVRKSIGLFGGLLHPNLSKHGVGLSLGVPDARLSFGPKHSPLLNIGPRALALQKSSQELALRSIG